MTPAQESITKARDRYLKLYDLAPVGYVTVDSDLLISEANHAAAALLGSSRHELTGARLTRFVTKSDHDACHIWLSKAVRSGEPVSATFRFKKPSDDILMLQLSTVHITSANAEKDELLISFTDLTLERRYLAALESSERRYRFLYKHAQLANVIISPDGHIQDVNEYALQSLGYPQAEVLNKVFTSFVVSSHRKTVAKWFDKIKRGQPAPSIDIPVLAKDRTQHTLMTTAANEMLHENGQPVGFLFSALDITKRKQAEEALRQSEQLYRSMAANLPNAGVFILDRELRYILAEGGALGQAGFRPEDLEGKTLWEGLDKSTAENYEPRFRQVLDGKTFEYEHQSHGRLYKSYGVPIRDSQGKVIYVLAMSHDITEQKHTEKALRKFSNLLETINKIINKSIQVVNTHDLGTHCLDILIEASGSESGFLGLIGRDGHMHDIAISRAGQEKCGMQDKTGHQSPIDDPAVQTLYTKVIKTKNSFFTNTPLKDPDSMGVPGGHPPLHNFLAAPLLYQDSVIGLIALANKIEDYDQDDAETINALAPTVTEAIMRVRAETAVRKSRMDLNRAQSVAATGSWRVNFAKKTCFGLKKPIDYSGFHRMRPSAISTFMPPYIRMTVNT